MHPAYRNCSGHQIKRSVRRIQIQPLPQKLPVVSNLTLLICSLPCDEWLQENPLPLQRTTVGGGCSHFYRGLGSWLIADFVQLQDLSYNMGNLGGCPGKISHLECSVLNLKLLDQKLKPGLVPDFAPVILLSPAPASSIKLPGLTSPSDPNFQIHRCLQASSLNVIFRPSDPATEDPLQTISKEISSVPSASLSSTPSDSRQS